MKKIYILHAGIGHVSPYMSALSHWLRKRKYEVKYIANIYDDFYSKDEIGYIYLHRLGRMYDNKSMDSAQTFIERLEFLRKQGQRILWTIHNFYPLDRVPNEVDQYVMKNVAKYADHIFAHTDTMKKNAELLFHRPVINHGYGTNQLLTNTSPPPKGLLSNNTKFTIAFWGNVRNYKNVDGLINAFNNVAKTGENIRLVIIGPHYEDTLKGLELSGAADICLVDEFIGNPRKYASAIDVFVCTYKIGISQFKYGFFPSSIGTLGMSGKPIICPACASVFDIIGEKGNVVLYHEQDEKSLEGAMLTVCKMKSVQRKRMGKRLKKHLKRQTWKKVVNIICNTIEKGEKNIGNVLDRNIQSRIHNAIRFQYLSYLVP